MENKLFALWLFWELSHHTELTLALHALGHMKGLLHEAGRLNEESAGMEAEVGDLTLLVHLVVLLLLLGTVLGMELVESLLEYPRLLQFLVHVEHLVELFVPLVHLEDDSAPLDGVEAVGAADEQLHGGLL